MRPFYLCRIQDVSGSSGTGVVAEGVEFSNGMCVMSWLTDISSIKIFQSMSDLDIVHSHGGLTVPVYADKIGEMAQDLEEEDPLLALLKDLRDREEVHKMQSEIPLTKDEALEVIARARKVDVNITNVLNVETKPVFRRIQGMCEEILNDTGMHATHLNSSRQQVVDIALICAGFREDETEPDQGSFAGAEDTVQPVADSGEDYGVEPGFERYRPDYDTHD